MKKPKIVIIFVTLISICAGMAEAGQIFPLGDTLTVIQRPLLNIPQIIRPQDTLWIECEAPASATNWSASLLGNSHRVDLRILHTMFDKTLSIWKISAVLPKFDLYELYDLEVKATGLADTTRHAVRIIPEFKDDFYFVHITDSHLPTHLYHYQNGSDTDTSEIVDLRTVIEDINIINPEFVLFTGDLVNEGELEDYLFRRYYSRAQKVLEEFNVPVYLTAGNHDIGGWDPTPPPDGTARMTWWRFFGWKRLGNPPPAQTYYTQDYSFNYGNAHFTGLEAYINYDGWRSDIYGSKSFTNKQLQWLQSDLKSAGSKIKVLFYHHDFSNQINLYSLGVDMSLSGHAHSNQDDWSHPYQIVTSAVCDGRRTYRLIRFSRGTLLPSRAVSAGADGTNLTVSYSPANDGTNLSVKAQIINKMNERFEHALLRFIMPKIPGIPHIEGGKIRQIDSTGQYSVWYVSVDIIQYSQQSVTAVLEPLPEAFSVRLIAPNGGEVFRIGDTLDIRWSFENKKGETASDLLLSLNGGITFDRILAKDLADSQFKWIVDSKPSALAVIKIVARDNSGQISQAKLDSGFAIVDGISPIVAVIEPARLDAWLAGSTQTIRWIAVDIDSIESVDILLSRDWEMTFAETLAISVPNSGSFLWHVKGPQTDCARIMVTAYDSQGNWSQGISDSTFSIIEPAGPPDRVAIEKVAPNPFTYSLEVGIYLPSDSWISIDLFDVCGRRIAKIYEGYQLSGNLRIPSWTPDDHITAGVYILVVKTEDGITSRKVVHTAGARIRK
ncbi:MAG: metallophosphoesterase [bacterium]